MLLKQFSQPVIYSLGAVITLILSSMMHPRLSLYLFPSKLTREFTSVQQKTPNLPAQELWQFREFNSIGTNFIVSSVSASPIAADYPDLTHQSFAFITQYHSSTIESLDLIINPEQASSVLHALQVSDLPINKAIIHNYNQAVWLIGYYDSSQTKQANGYVYERPELQNKVWIHISKLKV